MPKPQAVVEPGKCHPEKCHPEKCDRGICVAVSACPPDTMREFFLFGKERVWMNFCSVPRVGLVMICKKKKIFFTVDCQNLTTSYFAGNPEIP